ncbi:MAG: peptidoglycan-binding domain-containing protein [Pseudomonadota bacterium]
MRRLSVKMIRVFGVVLLALWAVTAAPGLANSPQGAFDLRKVQVSLNALGFNAGPEDGLAGPQTRAAIARFLVSQGWSGQGTLLPQQAQRLFALAELGPEADAHVAPSGPLTSQSRPMPRELSARKETKSAYRTPSDRALGPPERGLTCAQSAGQARSYDGSADLPWLACLLELRAQSLAEDMANAQGSNTQACTAQQDLTGIRLADLANLEPAEVISTLAVSLLAGTDAGFDGIAQARACLAEGYLRSEPSMRIQAALVLVTYGDEWFAVDLALALAELPKLKPNKAAQWVASGAEALLSAMDIAGDPQADRARRALQDLQMGRKADATPRGLLPAGR